MAKASAQVQSGRGPRRGGGAGIGLFVDLLVPTLAVACVIAVIGCAGTRRKAPHAFLDYALAPVGADLDTLLAAYPLAPGANVLAVELGRSETVSHHLVQVREGEAPHIHERHDLTVVMLRGTATLTVDAEQRAIDAGDVMFIPRGRAHFVRNTGRAPAVAFVVFSPPFQGPDAVPIDR